nr:polysaccharide biosynthesis C-terminal domain-containing protein [Rubrobacter sp.]
GISSGSGAVYVYAGAALVVSLAGSAWLWRSLRRGVPSEGRAASPEFETRVWMAVALPMVFGGLGQLLMNRLDVVMLGALAGSESVGLYSAALRFALLNVFVLQAANVVAAPLVASAFHSGRLRQARSILRQTTLIATLGALPLFVVMMLYPRALLGLFGPGFEEGAALLRVLALGRLAAVAAGPVASALLMTGREREFARVTGVLVVLNVVGNLVAIPILGAMGAALVTAACTMLKNVWLFTLVWGKGSSLRADEAP